LPSLFHRLVGFVAAALVVTTVAGELPPVKRVAAAPVPPAPRAAAEQSRALRELDRFLDHHPLIEDDLRLKPKSTSDPHYLERNPELRDFLAAVPAVAPALRDHPRYFLFRALRREAPAPLKISELASLAELLDRYPPIEHELTRHPEAIHDPAFLKTHPALGDFLLEHPPLDRFFLPPHRSTATQH
jgi:hypothetical protein